MLAPSGNKLYYVSLPSKNTIRVITLDPVTGAKQDEIDLGKESEYHSENDIILVGANSPTPVIVWTDVSRPTKLKANVLGTKDVTSFDITQSAGEVLAINIHAPQQSDASSHFLVHFQTADSHWAEVYHIDSATSVISKAFDVPSAAGHGAFSLSTSGASVYFTRFTEEHMILFSSTSSRALQKWPLVFTTLAAHDKVHPVHASTEVAVRSGSSYAVRSVVLFSSGDWAMIRNGDMSWSRPESLAGIVAAQWAIARVPDALVEELKVEGRSNIVSAYVHRVRRHLNDLIELPSHMKAMFGSGGKSESSDTFGFKKLILAATDNGRVIALEAGNQLEVAWSVGAKAKSASQPSLESIKGMLPDDISSTLEFADSTIQGGAKTTYELKDGSLQGTKGDTLVWQFSPRLGQRFLEVVSSHVNEPIASIGKALGNRQVLYKYLNPNAIIVTAVDEQNVATIYLLDSSSGSILHAAEHASVDASRPIAAAISENWFAYSLSTFASEADASTGNILVMSELYESSLANERGPLGATSNYSSLASSTTPFVISATFTSPAKSPSWRSLKRCRA